MNIFKTFSNLFHSVFGSIVFEPGLVDSPPKSIIFAPDSIIREICFIDLLNLLNLPPSEKLSGVRFRIPMIDGLLKFIFLRKFFLFAEIFFISFKTFFFSILLSFLIFLMSKNFFLVLSFFLSNTSILEKAIYLFPHKGRARFSLIN